MNVKIDIDISAEEMRKLLGLPDVEAFQREIMDDIRKRMLEGVEGYDPVKFFQPYVSGTLASWDLFQKMMSATDKGATDTAARGTKK
jgi:hypothetical protein